MRYVCPLCHQPVTFAQYQNIMAVLRRKEELSVKQMRDRIRKVERLAQQRAEKRAEKQLKALEKQLRATARRQLKEEREHFVQQAEKKYERANRTLRSILKSREMQLRNQDSRIRELERQLKRQTTPQLEGLLYEKTLIRELQKRFPEDRFKPTGKGGDILHSVMRKDEKVGLIVYECKRVKGYQKKYVKQASDAMNRRKADFAILVTNAMKKGTQGFFVERSVMVVHATGVLSLAAVVRSHIIQIAEMKLGRLERNKAIRATLDYIEGAEFTNSLDRIIHESIGLIEDLKKEFKEHVSRWWKRQGSYRMMIEEAFTVKTTSKALLSGETEPRKMAAKPTLPAFVELPEVKGT